MNIIWNDDEIKKINQLLKRANFKIDNNDLIKTNNNNYNYLEHPLVKEQKALNKLFHLQDKEEILELLKKTNFVKEIVEKDKTNPKYFGFLTEVSNININDATEIFNLYKYIVTLYCKIINKISTQVEDSLVEPELLKERIQLIKDSSEDTVEIITIKNYINSNLIYIKEIINNPIFSNLIEEKNNEIKNKLIKSLNIKYANSSIRNKIKKAYDYKSYVNERGNKLCRRKGKKPTNFNKG